MEELQGFGGLGLASYHAAPSLVCTKHPVSFASFRLNAKKKKNRKPEIGSVSRFTIMRQSYLRICLGALVCFALLAFLISFGSSTWTTRETLSQTSLFRPTSKISEGIANETLGFSKILVIGLPERTDKRDALALTSALTGFHVEFVDGVKGESIPDKAVPMGVDRHKLMETNLGSWRGHMNAIRRQVSVITDLFLCSA